MGKTNKDRHDNDDFFYGGQSSNDEYFEVDRALFTNLRKSPKKVRPERAAKRQKPERWDDDWTDPEDDLMFGFDDD